MPKGVDDNGNIKHLGGNTIAALAREMATNHSNFGWIALPRHARRLVMMVSECTTGYRPVGAVDVVVVAAAIRAKEQATVPESPEKVAYLLPSCRVPDVAPDGGPGRGCRRGHLEGR